MNTERLYDELFAWLRGVLGDGGAGP